MNKLTLQEEIQRVIEEAECLYHQDAVHQAIHHLSLEITGHIGDRFPLVLTVLNGGLFFTAELLLKLPFPLELDSIKAGRYRGSTTGAEMHWSLRPSLPLKDRTVLILDDILDEGHTLKEIIRFAQDEGASEIFSAVLVDKQIETPKASAADFVGLTTPNRYLFGYGLDYKNQLRHWPGIFACKTVY